MPTEAPDTTYEYGVRDHDDILDAIEEIDRRPRYTPVYGGRPGVYASTLDGLFRSGDLIVTDNGSIICIDLTIRRSGLTLYGSGHTMTEAIDEVYDQLMDHIDALNHLEDIGLNVSRLAELDDASDTIEFDPALMPVPDSIEVHQTDEATIAAVRDALLSVKDAISAADVAADEAGLPPVGIDFSVTPIVTDNVPAPVAAAAGEPIDGVSPGYILALLIPVQEGKA